MNTKLLSVCCALIWGMVFPLFSQTDAERRSPRTLVFPPEMKHASRAGTLTGVSASGADALWKRLLAEPLPKGVTISSIKYVGRGSSSGGYTGFPEINKQKVMDGIILTTGLARNAFGPNESTNASYPYIGAKMSGNTVDVEYPGDDQIQALLQQHEPTRKWESIDAVSLILEFTTDSTVPGLTFDFIYGSEEYTEYVGSAYNDAFAVFYNGQNITFDGNGNYISVNNNYFKIDNMFPTKEDQWGNVSAAGSAPYNIGYDGFTPLLRSSIPLLPGKHTLKFVISDFADEIWDSGVFLSNFKFQFTGEGTIEVGKFVGSKLFTIPENSPSGTFVGKFGAVIADSQNVVLKVLKTFPEFTVDLKTKTITVAPGAKLDFESVNEYKIPVEGIYKGTEYDTGEITIRLTDISVGDLISDTAFTIPENSPAGTFVGKLKLNVPDSIAVKLSLVGTSDEFLWDEKSRTITVADGAVLDYEKKNSFTIKIAGSANEAKNDTAAITIRLTDISVGDLISDASFTIPENSPAGTFVGKLKLNVPDSIAVKLSLVGTSDEFLWDEKSRTITVADGAVLDYEKKNSFTVKIAGSANEAKNDTAAITIRLTDISVGDLISDASFTIPENSPAGTFVGKLKLNVPDSIAVKLSLVGTSNEFLWDEKNRTITVADGAVLDYEKKNSFTIKIAGSANEAKDDTAAITIRLTDLNEVPAVPQIDSTLIFDRNGDGKGDSLAVFFNGAFNKILPGSCAFRWPENEKEISAEIESLWISENRYLKFPFEPKGGIATAGTGSIRVFFDSSSVNVERTGKITDKIGPLLTKASVYERFASGIDTFVTALTEDVLADAVSGSSFILIKKEGDSQDREIILNVIGSARSVGNGASIQFSADLKGYTPQNGDSLRILSSGSVTDLLKNHAHEKNRAVPLSVVPRPVPIRSAFYFDRDGNGEIDHLRIEFEKKVSNLGDLSVSAVWNSDSVTAIAGELSYDQSNDRAVEAVVDFGKNGSDRTSGAMSVSVQFGMLGSSSADAEDSAAPVITEALYIQGRSDGSDESSADSLILSYSEEISGITSSEPFRFKVSSGEEYHIFMRNSTVSGRRSVSAVESITDTDFPADGDSVWINSDAGLRDQRGTEQKVTMNQRAPLTVRTAPFSIRVAVNGPSDPVNDPFPSLILSEDSPEFTTGLFALAFADIVVPRSVFSQIECSAVIFDAVGNPVAEGRSETQGGSEMKIYTKNFGGKPSMVFLWSGKNGQGRYVGSGAYYFMVKLKHPDGRIQMEKAYFLVKNK